MNSYLLVIKDRNEVFKEETSPSYLHENAAYNFLVNKFGEYDFNRLTTIEIGTKGYIVISVSKSYIMIVLPEELNNDQKLYLLNAKKYLKDNVENLSIIDIEKIDDEFIHIDYFGENLKENFDKIIDNKTQKNKTLQK